MAHPILFGLLGAFVISRLVLRGHRRRWRHAHGGGCGRFGAGPIDSGAPDADGASGSERLGRRFGRFGGRFGRFSRRWQRGQTSARAEIATVPARANVAGALRAQPAAA